MTNIAILGFGVVGGGITEVIDQNKEKLLAYTGEEIYVKKILDLRTFPGIYPSTSSLRSAYPQACR